MHKLLNERAPAQNKLQNSIFFFSEQCVDSLKKLEIELPCEPAVPLLDIHTEETRIEKDTSIPMLITALFIIAKTWKQSRCPSADK